MPLPESESVAAQCVRCAGKPWEPPVAVKRFGRLWQVICGNGRKHRTRYYPDRRSAVMAWNLAQKNHAARGHG